jgi:hypothetical protein
MAHGNNVDTRRRRFALIAAALSAFLAAGLPASATDAEKAVTGLEYRGTVYDLDTKQPLEGVYVVAGYYVATTTPPVVAVFCKKTRGMYTGPDGKFAFPVEKRDGRSPRNASAIKSGYSHDHGVQIHGDVWTKQDQAAYSGHDIYLRRQDEKMVGIRFGQGDERCDHAETAEDAAAAAQFLRIEAQERKRLGASSKVVDGVLERARALEMLPSRSAVSGGAK